MSLFGRTRYSRLWAKFLRFFLSPPTCFKRNPLALTQLFRGFHPMDFSSCSSLPPSQPQGASTSRRSHCGHPASCVGSNEYLCIRRFCSLGLHSGRRIAALRRTSSSSRSSVESSPHIITL